MRLNPKEQEKLMLHFAGKLAEERKNRGLKLNYVESVAYISSELFGICQRWQNCCRAYAVRYKNIDKR